MRTQSIILALALVGSGCHVGARADTLALAHGPFGAMVELDAINRGTVSGELLAAEDTALIIRRGRTMVPILYSQIGRVSFPEVHQRYALQHRHSLDTETLARLRLLSRFPQGITPGLRTRLGAIYLTDSVSR